MKYAVEYIPRMTELWTQTIPRENSSKIGLHFNGTLHAYLSLIKFIAVVNKVMSAIKVGISVPMLVIRLLSHELRFMLTSI